MSSAPFTSFRPGAVWPDNQGVHINAHGGGMLYHEGVYYWFGEHKIAGTAGNAAHVGVHCYTSTDLYNWTDAGIALAVEDDPASDITKGVILERPKVVYNAATGRFVMWFHLETLGVGYGSARTGVAVAEQPAGPYRFLCSMRMNAGQWPMNVAEEEKAPPTAEEQAFLDTHAFPGGPVPYYPLNLIYRRDHAVGQMSRDMTVFVDDDGAAYHIHASEDNGTLHISQLSEDYLQPNGKYVRVLAGRFHEAPAVFKHAGKYYMFSSDCTGWAPNAARLSTADSIWGPWTELGNPCVGSEDECGNTFTSQSTYVLPVAGQPNAYIFLADRWNPDNAIDGRYIWLPVQWKYDTPFLAWLDEWDLSFFNK